MPLKIILLFLCSKFIKCHFLYYINLKVDWNAAKAAARGWILIKTDYTRDRKEMYNSPHGTLLILERGCLKNRPNIQFLKICITHPLIHSPSYSSFTYDTLFKKLYT